MSSHNNFRRFFVVFLNTILFILMGRKLKYKTEEERKIARNKLRMKYYWKNSKNEKQKALERYYENKRNLQDNK